MIFSNKRGFTVLEIIIVIGILSVGVVGLVFLLNFAVMSTGVSSDRLIASDLAQEGLEVVRHWRDVDNNWNNWFATVANDTYRAVIDVNVPNNWFMEPNPATYLLRYDPNSGLYHYEGGVGVPTTFERRITIASVSAVEKRIISQVRWTNRGRTYIFSVEDRLFNWH